MRHSLLLAACCLSLAGLDTTLIQARSADRQVRQTIVEVTPAFVFVGQASGVLIGSEGHLLSNYHVLCDERTGRVAREWLVRTATGLHWADVVGLDPVGDLALLRMREPGPWPGVRLAAMDTVRSGDPVIALGNPFSTAQRVGDPSATTGIVSARHRYIAEQGGDWPDLLYPDALQTDAAINPGNSGGPLFDAKGRLVGINGQIRSRYGARANTGIGLAIPADQILRFLPALERAAGGHVQHGRLAGVRISEDRSGERPGLPIIEVRADSIAHRDGLRAGDRVLAVDGRTMHSASNLYGACLARPAGAVVQLRIVRGEVQRDLAVELAAHRIPVLGVRLDRTPASPMAGLMVRGLIGDSPLAESAEILPGDRLLTLDGRLLRSQQDIRQILRLGEWQPGGTIGVILDRMGKRVAVTVVLGTKYP